MEDNETRLATDPSIVADLRLRLQSSQKQEFAARAEVRLLSRELALMRRLLRFSTGSQMPTRPPKTEEGTRQRADSLEQTVYYHIDVCDEQPGHTTVSGWAFRPAPGWNGGDTVITLIFRHGATVYYAPANRVARPDVAAHYAAQSGEVTGGARGLDGVGFACEIVRDSLPGGRDWDLALRLDCAGMTCEQATSHRLHS